MKTSLNLFLAAAAILLAPVARADDEAAVKSDAVKIKQNAQGETVLTLDEATQKRLGLAVTAPMAAEWHAQIPATGRVADPLVFAAAVADYEAMRAAATAAHVELERTQKLAAQENTSPRALEAAQAAAARDQSAWQAAHARFAADWGLHLAEQTNLPALAAQLQAGSPALIKLSLPAGTFLNPPPKVAAIHVFNEDAKSITATCVDDLGIDASTQRQTLLFEATDKIPRNIAVTGDLRAAGAALAGVAVPGSAILRHANQGWVYLQTGPTEFTRHELALDRPLAGDFFSANLSTNSRIVVTGAQTLLSAELSGGDFNSGQRD